MVSKERGGAFCNYPSLLLNIVQNAPPLSQNTLKHPVIPSEARNLPHIQQINSYFSFMSEKGSPEYQHYTIFVYKD
jgi:hypothetical protein